MAPKIGVILDSPSAGVALRSGLFDTEHSVEAKRDRLLEELNRFKMKNEHLKSFYCRTSPRWRPCLHVPQVWSKT